jgi:tetratricopeptide (TPR) repeat protein
VPDLRRRFDVRSTRLDLLGGLSFDSSVGRLLLAGAILAIFLSLLGLSLRNFLLRFAADPRFTLSPAALDASLARLPHSPRLHRLRSQQLLLEGSADSAALAAARVHALSAIRWQPRDYQAHLLLGSIEELAGDLQAAEVALREATQLAPTIVEPNWALANLWLRQGELSQALPPLRRATAAREWLLPAACDLLWRASGAGDDGAGPVRSDSEAAQLLFGLANGVPRHLLLLANFLLDRKALDLAVESYRRIPLVERNALPHSGAWLTRLITLGEITQARQLWGELRESAPLTDGNLLWNGGFEVSIDPRHPHFDWQLKSSEFMRVAVDPTTRAEGASSLRLQLVGRDTTRLGGEVRQQVAIPSFGQYRLSFQVKTRDLRTPGGPRITVRYREVPLAISDPIEEGTTQGWEQRSLDFTIPEGAGLIELSIIRQPRFSYDEPTRGLIWIDDLRLVRLPPEGVAGVAGVRGGAQP